MQKVLVTGGAGYIGAHVCKLLHESGYFPIVLDNLSTGLRKNILFGELIEGDLKDIKKLELVFSEHAFCAVIHLAGRTYPRESLIHAGEYYSDNVISTINLLNVMRDFGIRKIIFSSTCSVYSGIETSSISENHEQSPANIYGRTKLIIEQILKDYYKAYGINSITFRFFNAAGACENLKIGENVLESKRIISLILKSTLKEEVPLVIYGDSHPTKDGTSIRDYVHVEDLARAHIIGMESLLSNQISLDVFNLGSGKGKSIKEVLRICEKVTKKNIKVTYDKAINQEASVLVANIEKVKNVLNWMPEKSELENIISSSWNWYKQEIDNG